MFGNDDKSHQNKFIISFLKVLPVYKTSCLCGIMFRDKYIDLYMSIYGIWTLWNLSLNSQTLNTHSLKEFLSVDLNSESVMDSLTV